MNQDLFSIDPVALVILFAAGLGVIYVVRIFTQAQTVREREMWTAIQSILNDVKEINSSWLQIVQSQGDKSNDSIKTLSNNIAAHTEQMSHLTQAINMSIEKGASLKVASDLMVEVLRDGRDGRRSVQNEKK